MRLHDSHIQPLATREETVEQSQTQASYADTLDTSKQTKIEARTPDATNQHLIEFVTKTALIVVELSPPMKDIVHKFITTLLKDIQSEEIDPTNFILFQPDDASAPKDAYRRQGRRRSNGAHTAKTLLDLLARDAWTALNRFSPKEQGLVLQAADAVMAVFADDVAMVVGKAKQSR